MSASLVLPYFHDNNIVAQDKTNKVRIGTINRARAKLFEEQMNSLLQ